MLRNNEDRNYGWDLDLTCPRCGASGLPRYEGWSPSLQWDSGAHVRVYAKVACPRCGNRLTSEAGKKLFQLFSPLDIPERNRKIISQFIFRLFLVPAVMAFVLFFGMQMDWWSWGLGTIGILAISAVVTPLIVLSRNRQLSALAKQCECGKPQNVYLGSIGDNHCYRCFSCGRLIKIRE